MKKIILLLALPLLLVSCQRTGKAIHSNSEHIISEEIISSKESISSSVEHSDSSIEETTSYSFESSEVPVMTSEELVFSSEEAPEVSSSISEEIIEATSSEVIQESSSEIIEESSELPSISSEETIMSSEEEIIDISSEEQVLTESSIFEESSEVQFSSEEEIIYSSGEQIEESSEEIVSSEEQNQPNPMNEPYIARQYYLNHIGDIYSVWKQYRGKGITIAVIDVGFLPTHEDFYFEDGTSKVSEKSASFVTKGSTTTTSVGIDKVVNEGESHGTFCAGVAAAGLNGKGVIGIAPEASLLLLKTDLKPKSIAAAFRYAADNGAKVVTISIGSYYNYGGDLVDDGSDLGTVFDAPVKYCVDKGVAVISAGGNGGLDGQPTEFTFPGCVDNVIGVGGLAANKSSEIWEGSSYNSSPAYQSIDVFAPADMMFGCCHYGGKKYDSGWNGTSFASPIVAGMAALYFEKNPNNSVAQFTTDLFSSCHKITTSSIASSSQLGYGRVDVGALLDISTNEDVTVKVADSRANGYFYYWNSVTNKPYSSWPGSKVTKKNGIYEIKINPSKYDSVIFTVSNSGPQTVDLQVSSFIYENTYSLTGSTKEVNCEIGKYI